jgi:hypothetical protein
MESGDWPIACDLPRRRGVSHGDREENGRHASFCGCFAAWMKLRGWPTLIQSVKTQKPRELSVHPCDLRGNAPSPNKWLHSVGSELDAVHETEEQTSTRTSAITITGSNLVDPRTAIDRSRSVEPVIRNRTRARARARLFRSVTKCQHHQPCPMPFFMLTMLSLSRISFSSGTSLMKPAPAPDVPEPDIM